MDRDQVMRWCIGVAVVAVLVAALGAFAQRASAADPPELRRWGWQAVVITIEGGARWVTFSDGTSVVCEPAEGDLWRCPHPGNRDMVCTLDGQVWCSAPRVRREA